MKDKTYKLTRVTRVPVQVENMPTEYRRTVETVHTGKTWAEAKALCKQDRSLTITEEAAK